MENNDRPAPSFATTSGHVRGWLDGEVVRATGIPYAVAERFAEPQSAPAWNGLFEATSFSPACPQIPVPLLEKLLGYRTSDIRTDEDCLRLSVTMPAGATSGSLPVMVWLHGGSYVSGAGDLRFMDPAALVSEQNVIVVTVTYRLGVFGYIGGSSGRAANLGLLDQLAALDWVHENIAAFGGDADNVTLFGESAGADAVLHLLATPDINTRVRRAIVQSAPLGLLSRRRSRMHEAMAASVAGVSAAAAVDDVLAHQAGAEAAARGYGLTSLMPFGPQVGYAPLPDRDGVAHAWDAIAPGLDLMIGHTAQEARLFVFDVPILARLGRVPLAGRQLQNFLSWILTSIIYARPARRLARRFRRAGARVRTFTITWAAPGNRLGSAHTVDLALLFGDSSAWSDAELVRGSSGERLAAHGRMVRTVWGAFARGDDLPPRLTIRDTLTSRTL